MQRTVQIEDILIRRVVHIPYDILLFLFFRMPKTVVNLESYIINIILHECPIKQKIVVKSVKCSEVIEEGATTYELLIRDFITSLRVIGRDHIYEDLS